MFVCDAFLNQHSRQIAATRANIENPAATSVQWKQFGADIIKDFSLCTLPIKVWKTYFLVWRHVRIRRKSPKIIETDL
jgi:hypothetical protein